MEWVLLIGFGYLILWVLASETFDDSSNADSVHLVRAIPDEVVA